MEKKIYLFTCLLFSLLIVVCINCSSPPPTRTNTTRISNPATSYNTTQSQNMISSVTTDDLDQTIREASTYLNQNIPARSKIVILNIESSSDALSDYVIQELIANAVNDKNFTVVDRKQLSDIRDELKFQLSGEVADDQAVKIGQLFGAQTIISGVVSPLGNGYRFSIRALSVQSGYIQGQFNKNISAERTITALVSPNVVKPNEINIGTGITGIGATATPTSTPNVSTIPVVSTPNISPVSEYKIFDVGPAGGYIFYDKGNNSDGWRYLEVAPAYSEKYVRWGLSGKVCSGTKTGIGSGSANTKIITRLLSINGEQDRAAQICEELDISGYSDWFLPSKDELNLLYQNLGQNGFKGGYYWSSSVYDQNTNHAWCQRFSGGSQSDGRRSIELWVRAIRAF